MAARKGVAVATTMSDLLKRTGTGSLQERLAASPAAHSVDILSTGGIALSKAGCVGGVHSELWQYQTRAVANTPQDRTTPGSSEEGGRHQKSREAQHEGSWEFHISVGEVS